MKSVKNIVFKPYGKHAILIEWEAVIDKNINKKIIQYKSLIQKKSKYEIEDFIIGYHSLLIKYKFQILNFSSEVLFLKNIYEEKVPEEVLENYTWKIPVCYELEFGIDLEELSTKLTLPISQIIQIHSETIYTVYFIGFLPGFMYLGGLNERIHFNRKATPRLKVPTGSVAIGGSQTGVYPQESAGGWNIIGNSPISFFNINNAKPCFVSAGDQIQFLPVTKEEYNTIQQQVLAGNYKLSKNLIV